MLFAYHDYDPALGYTQGLDAAEEGEPATDVMAVRWIESAGMV